MMNNCIYMCLWWMLLFAPVKVISARAATRLAYISNPFSKIKKDYLALTRRVTARHILLPPNSDQAILELKRSIRRRVDKPRDGGGENYDFVVDVFEDAAKKFSRDDTTNYRGGLIGELVPQGTCKSAILDEACFRVPLGSLHGPIESEYGIHLLLVSERTNCPKLDGAKTKLVPCRETGYGQLVPSSSDTVQESQVTPNFLLGQGAFWAVVFLGGGIVAELAARVGGS